MITPPDGDTLGVAAHVDRIVTGAPLLTAGQATRLVALLGRTPIVAPEPAGPRPERDEAPVAAGAHALENTTLTPTPDRQTGGGRDGQR